MNNFTLNIYKAFGIKKLLEPPHYVELSGGYEDWIGETEGNDPRRGFKTPRHAMKYAIEHVRQKDTNYAYIYHPTKGMFGEGGMTRLSTHSQTNNLTLTHVRHGIDINELYDDSNLRSSERDIHSLDRMKYLQQHAVKSLQGEQLDIDTSGLYDLPDELHTSSERSLEP